MRVPPSLNCSLRRPPTPVPAWDLFRKMATPIRLEAGP